MNHTTVESRRFCRGQISQCLQAANARLNAAATMCVDLLRNFHDLTPAEISNQLARIEGQRIELLEDLRLCQKNIEALAKLGPPQLINLQPEPRSQDPTPRQNQSQYSTSAKIPSTKSESSTPTSPTNTPATETAGRAPADESGPTSNNQT